jgi:hypothetical protein
VIVESAVYLTFLGRELERLYFDVLFRKHEQWLAVLREPLSG